MDSNPFDQVTIFPRDDDFQFQVTACDDLYLILTQSPGSVQTYAYEIVFGSDNNQVTSFTKHDPYPQNTSVNTPDILNCNGQFQLIRVSWFDRFISINATTTNGDNEELTWHDTNNAYSVGALSLATRQTTSDVIWKFAIDAGEWFVSTSIKIQSEQNLVDSWVSYHNVHR